MPQSYAALYCHFVFATKYRRPQITDDIQRRLYGYIGGILDELDCKLLAVGGTADHIHLLVSISRERSVAEILRVVKTNSSRWVRHMFPHKRDFRWQDGYGAFTVGEKGVDRVRAYIMRQKEHHRTKTYRTEVIGFFERYHAEWDERFFADTPERDGGGG